MRRLRFLISPRPVGARGGAHCPSPPRLTLMQRMQSIVRYQGFSAILPHCVRLTPLPLGDALRGAGRPGTSYLRGSHVLGA
eukprot:1195190-Pyramimonas_sp.AAC.1